MSWRLSLKSFERSVQCLFDSIRSAATITFIVGSGRIRLKSGSIAADSIECPPDYFRSLSMHDSGGEKPEQQTMTNAVKNQLHADEQSAETTPAEHKSGTSSEASAPTRLPNETTMPTTSSSKRVLIVDDELFILEIMEIMLSRMGYCVDSTASSENALAMLDNAAEPYDLILADLTMPEMTGPQLARHVRRRYPAIPMILVTGLDVGGPDQPDETTLFDAVLTKPVSFANLKTAVRRILALRP